MNGRIILIAGAAALALTAGGCRFSHHFGGRQAAADTGAIKDSISAQEKTWNEQFQARPMNVDDLVSHYAPDAYFVAPGLKPANGADAVRKAYVEGLKDPNFAISFSADKIDVAESGDMAYSRGRFTEKYTDPATKKAASASGSFITVYRKQSDGSWKAVEDFAAADPAS